MSDATHKKLSLRHLGARQAHLLAAGARRGNDLAAMEQLQ